MENEAAFVAPEGVYSVTDEHKPNVAQLAAVSAGPSLHPTRVTKIVVKFPASKQGGSQGFANLLGGGKDVKKDKVVKEKEDGVSLSSSDTPDEAEGQQPSSSQEHASSPAPPEANTIFSSSSNAHGKKKNFARPKHNIKTTSSTFITRIQTSEGLTKTLASKQGDVTFLFFNSAKTFSWVEAGSKAKEPLIRVTFSQHPTCHDVNTTTASSEHLDVIIGFATGDLIWFVSHADGTIVVYDKEKEDGTFTPQDPSAPAPDASSSSDEGSSQREWDPLDNIFVTMPPWHPASGAFNGGKADKEKIAKNPVSHWRVSRRSVVDFVFSPDVKYVAAISEDGCLRVIDALQEQLAARMIY
ncbi:hypothetical protein EST38_g7236 [Candolleomyces aberdarensis]|uniref:Uncharacterized protein n=1 Tax=Candolleomyces aberdarensis TaxID=2316362 RepID=A0A4Q2DHI3_9AGAR|nr:hypothetical protein EST38_g7236 [Candolleomyces aberdarensis]